MTMVSCRDAAKDSDIGWETIIFPFDGKYDRLHKLKLNRMKAKLLRIARGLMSLEHVSSVCYKMLVLFVLAAFRKL